ncbi:MAG TPA: hypothetical protein PK014_13555 [Thermoanaerobaculia bacterium]|nr:hypothetical protein [Thermoanaerobaculia bacterium]HUM28500.1 hypothetical protein [Thermoanaerobaculia bacterium]HXK66892.1 hypothetical protein [Thermoanaerobaculia bacterium]
MSRSRKFKIRGGFIQIPLRVLNSNAFQDLPPSASKIWLYFVAKVKLPFEDPDRYGVVFSFSYGEARRFGFSAGTFSNGIRALIKNGFLDPVKKGGLKSAGGGFNQFKQSKRWERYGTPLFVRRSWDEIV